MLKKFIFKKENNYNIIVIRPNMLLSLIHYIKFIKIIFSFYSIIFIFLFLLYQPYLYYFMLLNKKSYYKACKLNCKAYKSNPNQDFSIIKILKY